MGQPIRASAASDSAAAPGSFPILLQRGTEVSLPVQLAAALRDAIDDGILHGEDAVQPSRELARQLGVSRGVVVAAYEQLIAEGYLQARQGGRTVVHASAPGTGPVRGAGGAGDDLGARSLAEHGDTEPAAAASSLAARGPLAPGAPITDAVVRPAWRAAWRSAVARAHLEAPALGDPQLRAEIADHLRRMRGVHRAAADLVVTAGARDGLHLLLTALTQWLGRSPRVGVEDPGYPSLRRVVGLHGATMIPVAVDADGLDPRSLPEQGIDAVIVTPSHQYPLGGSLPLARRRELIAWASRCGAVIIEDDYDSELRHVGNPLPALAAIDDPVGGSVALLGTFSKTISPSLSAGYLLLPERLIELVVPVRRTLGGPVSAVVQRALAEFLASGELRRHTARMRRQYSARRALITEQLGGIPGVRARVMSGGLHTVVELSGTEAPELERLLTAELIRGGLGGVPLSRYWQSGTGGAAEQYGLVIGTGRSDIGEFAQSLGKLRALLLRELRQSLS